MYEEALKVTSQIDDPTFQGKVITLEPTGYKEQREYYNNRICFIMYYVCTSFSPFLMETCSFHVHTQVAVLCLKLYHLKERDVTYFIVLKGERREGDKSAEGIKERKKG